MCRRSFAASRTSIDALGEIDVQDVVFHSEVADGEDDLTMTIYYFAHPRSR